MKIYTKTGDGGESALVGGQRVRKSHDRLAAYGTVDELNAALGVARAEIARGSSAPIGLDALLAEIQNRLFDLGAELASPDPVAKKTALLEEADALRLEAAIDSHEEQLPTLRQFILPGGTATAAALHLARTICRRAERLIVVLNDREPIRDTALVYVNRLGDLLFVLARAANHAAGVADVPWTKR
jgi:cob(I)alamin adenosyltransferase